MDNLEAISQPQRERLFHIDFRAEFLGSVTRAHLVRRFGLTEPSATRDLALYRALAPDNLVFDQSGKIYRRGEAFRSLFTHDPARTLTALSEGIGDDAVGEIGPHVRTAHPLRLNPPGIAIIAAVCRAIAGATSLDVRYQSLTSGETVRTVIPFALVDTGTRWHARAFDTARERYLDFVLTRLIEATPGLARSDYESLREADAQWMRLVDLELVPHPGLSRPEVIARDYAMTEGVLHVRLRAALVGYALLHWSVDATGDHRLSPERHHLWLRNRAALYGVDNLSIAPGVDENP